MKLRKIIIQSFEDREKLRDSLRLNKSIVSRFIKKFRETGHVIATKKMSEFQNLWNVIIYDRHCIVYK